MEIKDKREVWEECKKEMLNLIKGITEETDEEQTRRYLNDCFYHSAIEYLTQMLFTIKTDERFIAAERKVQSEYMYHEMKNHFKLYGVDIE